MTALKSLLTLFLGDPQKRVIKQYQPQVDKINALESEFQGLSDEALQAKGADFKTRLEAKTVTLDDLLPEAFAAVREVARRVLGMRHFDVQLIGGIILHEGKISEMRTGEGKTLMATLPAYLNALEGKGVYIVTVNDYLAKRDKEWMGKIFEFLGLKVGVIQSGMSPDARLEAYNADITYGTNNEFGFDYLRDNLSHDISECCQNRRHFAIIDEVDSILIDEARTPLIISGPVQDSTEKYKDVAAAVRKLEVTKDFTLDEKHKNVVLTEEGTDKLESLLGVSNLYSMEYMEYAHMAVQCIKALHLYKRDIDYVVKEGEIVIVDEFTGRLMEGRRYSDGLHQSIEAMEAVAIKEESQTLASITFQNYFRMFPKLSGMSGSAATEAEEFENIYGLAVVSVPTNQPVTREDAGDIIYKTKAEKYKAIIEEIKKRHTLGQPVLVGTIAIETSELLSKKLRAEKIPHNVLNAKQHEKEAEIIKNAGEKGAVTIATNMAGRGTDIKLGKGAIELGGLCVLGSERHESRRIDNQLRGRSGRQGDPGFTRFFVSLEDDLMRMFGSDRIASVMERLGMPDDTPIEHALITKSIEKAQKKVEKYHFSVRKQILEYDDVMNKQRKTIYEIRRKILAATELKSVIVEGIRLVVKDIYDQAGPLNEENKAAVEDYLEERVLAVCPVQNFKEQMDAVKSHSEQQEKILKMLENFYEYRKSQYPENLFEHLVAKQILLVNLDRKWMEHLHNMDILREGIGLRAWGQRNPLLEYKKEGFDFFNQLRINIFEEALTAIFRAVIVQSEEPVA